MTSTEYKNLTPWYPGDVKPARDGVYQRLYDEGTDVEGPEYCLFKDGIWMTWCKSPEEASEESDDSAFQGLPWRGLARDDAIEL